MLDRDAGDVHRPDRRHKAFFAVDPGKPAAVQELSTVCEQVTPVALHGAHPYTLQLHH